jgi:hypothetical protein
MQLTGQVSMASWGKGERMHVLSCLLSETSPDLIVMSDKRATLPATSNHFPTASDSAGHTDTSRL